MKTIAVIPTYNERDNIRGITAAALANLPEGGEVLVVDDNSPDGTGDIADSLAAADSRVHVLHRTKKEGLGRAYIAGFAEALRLGADKIIEMDADFSHPVERLGALASSDADVTIGSRYVKGGKCEGWPLRRYLVSRLGGLFIRFMTGLKVNDPTGGFKCFTRRALENFDFSSVESMGYSFQFEMNYRMWKKGYSIKEIPITFTDRRAGVSKITPDIAKETLRLVFKLSRFK